MRLHPVIPMVVRHLMEPATVGGHRPARGARTSARRSSSATPARTATATRRRSGRERFLDGEVATNTWIPFGGGVRRCIGAGFSLMEGVAVLREVLLRYDVALPAGRPDDPQGPQHHQRPAPRRPGGRASHPARGGARSFLSASVEETVASGDRGGLGAAAGAQLGEDVGDVHADGLGADEQLSRDLAVAAALRHQPEDLGLPRRSARSRAGILGCRSHRARLVSTSNGCAPSDCAVARAATTSGAASASRPTARRTAASRAWDRAIS